MAHFAELNAENIVLRVLIVSNDVIVDENGQEQESLGVDFLNGLFGPSDWKQCSYNGNIRQRFPGIGSEYIPEIDAFSELSPYPSWVLNRSTGVYEAPIERPDYDSDTHFVFWDEESLQWIIRVKPPKFDKETHYAYWDEDTNQWIIAKKPESSQQ